MNKGALHNRSSFILPRSSFLFLSRKDVASLLTMDDCIEAVEGAFRRRNVRAGAGQRMRRGAREPAKGC
jgi:hypothetical protein